MEGDAAAPKAPGVMLLGLGAVLIDALRPAGQALMEVASDGVGKKVCGVHGGFGTHVGGLWLPGGGPGIWRLSLEPWFSLHAAGATNRWVAVSPLSPSSYHCRHRHVLNHIRHHRLSVSLIIITLFMYSCSRSYSSSSRLSLQPAPICSSHAAYSLRRRTAQRPRARRRTHQGCQSAQ